MAPPPLPQTSIFYRALLASPLLLIFYISTCTFSLTLSAIPSISTTSPTISLNSTLSVPFHTIYTTHTGLDSLIANYVGFFTPLLGGFDEAGRLQAIGFLADLVGVLGVWFVEGLRGPGILIPLILCLVAQIVGIAYIAPLTYFAHYVFTQPLPSRSEPEKGTIPLRQLKALIPTITLSYIIPGIAMMVALQLSTRQWINGLFWQPFPIYAFVYQNIFSFFLPSTPSSRFTKQGDEIGYLRALYAFSGTISASAYLYLHLTSPIPLLQVFFGGLKNPDIILPLIGGAVKVLRYDHLTSLGATLVWVSLGFGELRKAGIVKVGWATILAGMVGCTVVFGPGAAMVGMWWWREEALAKSGARKSLKNL